MVSEKRLRGKPMPGVAEPDDDEGDECDDGDDGDDGDEDDGDPAPKVRPEQARRQLQ